MGLVLHYYSTSSHTFSEIPPLKTTVQENELRYKE